MDYEFSDRRGPVDANSPFVKGLMANDKKREHDMKSTFSNPSLTQATGSYTAFNSPGKKGNFPQLSEPNNQAFLFNQNVLPSPHRNSAAFTTPRKSSYEVDFMSSGPDTSPGMKTQTEDTPDAKPLPAIPLNLQKKEKRNSLSNFFGRWAPSSGSGIKSKRPYTDAVEKRVHKKRRQAQTFEKQLARARRESEESSDDDQDTPVRSKRSARSKSSKKELPPPPQEIGYMTSLFTFIHTYPDAPSIIAKYLQVFFNALIFSGVLFMFYSFYATIRADVDKASEDAYQDILAEITACHRHYIDNRCNAANRLPALEGPCSNWELCMNRDASAVRRARLSAHTFAEIFNSFVEPISLKTMVFTVVIVGLALLINNATFTLYRRSQEHTHIPQGQYRQYSGQHGMGQYNMTPGLPYAPQQFVGWQEQGKLEYPQSPSKRDGSPEKKRLMLDR